ncbi:hypothetical protein GQ55_6G090000 [Panicum hallii var. hallii]|uniref:Uncharacterized protein n=1 Tax=Panicum hallii var. hallii TaxID=1504633 RepID=A0A2T7D5J7_9POAL|nr:hypothetical protein GQ55_6G090000 [Panicum hallii var. hallii]
MDTDETCWDLRLDDLTGPRGLGACLLLSCSWGGGTCGAPMELNWIASTRATGRQLAPRAEHADLSKLCESLSSFVLYPRKIEGSVEKITAIFRGA